MNVANGMLPMMRGATASPPSSTVCIPFVQLLLIFARATRGLRDRSLCLSTASRLHTRTVPNDTPNQSAGRRATRQRIRSRTPSSSSRSRTTSTRAMRSRTRSPCPLAVSSASPKRLSHLANPVPISRPLVPDSDQTHRKNQHAHHPPRPRPRLPPPTRPILPRHRPPRRPSRRPHGLDFPRRPQVIRRPPFFPRYTNTTPPRQTATTSSVNARYTSLLIPTNDSPHNQSSPILIPMLPFPSDLSPPLPPR